MTVGIRGAWSLAVCVLLAACGGDDTGSAPDSGTTNPDAAIPIDGAPACSEDSECSDGVYCNGEERCLDTVCVRGARRTCDDGIACTIDICSESARACRHSAPDFDRDGHQDATCLDSTGVPFGDDCDDNNPNRYPGNREVCDPNDVDEDCDDTTYGALDHDGDGFDSVRCCNVSADDPEVKHCGDDCNDLRASIRPGVAEICDKLDNDCDGIVDEGATVMLYVDADRDGRGSSDSAAVPACAGSVGFSVHNDDCDDTNVAIHGVQPEFCDEIDNDCDGVVDEDTSAVAWYVDADGDGFGNPVDTAIASCVPIPERSLLRTDCNDDDAMVHPAAPELCDAIDNDCSGSADFVIAPGDLEDDDGDGSADIACGPAGLDCDDNDPTTSEGSTEICDGYDNDCDGIIDENVPNTVWYLDFDGDGYGDSSAPAVVLCAPISGRTPFGGDCNDRDPAVNPAATEVCNGRDDDCNGIVDDSDDLIEAGCTGELVLVRGTIYASQGGTNRSVRGFGGGSLGSGMTTFGTQATTRVRGAKVTLLHHTGTIIQSLTAGNDGSFSVRVPRGAVFVIVEPPDTLASSLVGSAIPVTGPRNDVEIYLHDVADLVPLSPSDLNNTGVVIASFSGAAPAGGQGIVFDPATASSNTRARNGLATTAGTVLPAMTPGSANDGLPFAYVAAVDVPVGSYVAAPLSAPTCRLTEGNYFGNRALVVAHQWPVRANVVTWVPVDCSPPLADCCDPCGFSCSDSAVISCAAAQDAYCSSVWDSNCVANAMSSCIACPSTSSCFAAHPGAGCDDTQLAQAVCTSQRGDYTYPSCCTDTWANACALEATRLEASECDFQGG